VSFVKLVTSPEIHQALLSHFSLLKELLFAKVLVKDRDIRIFKVGESLPRLLIKQSQPEDDHHIG
jgi:hypothetical protein